MSRASMIRNVVLALPLTLPLATGCSGHSGSDNEVTSSLKRNTTPSVASSDVAAAATGERSLGLDLYKQLATDPSKNVFLSPHSISEALTMVYAGAGGNTATQLRTVLHAQLPDAQLHPAMNALDLALESRGQGQAGDDGAPFSLKVANALWGQKGFSFQAPFLDTIATDYGSGVHTVDFITATETSRTTINDWVAQQTNDKITNLLPDGSVDPSTRLVLTNAVYFNASWQTPFQPSQTQPATFTRADASTVQAQMMHGSFEGQGVTGNGVSAVAIPYAGQELSMIVIVPDDLASFESTVTGDSIEALVGQLHPAEITLALPRWKFTYANDLAPSLEALGATDAFTPKVADFSGIDGSNDLFIQGVVHKAFINVDESGTEAAAATGITVGTSAVEQGFDLTVDKPFFFVIRDNATGATVFIGRVVDPTAS